MVHLLLVQYKPHPHRVAIQSRLEVQDSLANHLLQLGGGQTGRCSARQIGDAVVQHRPGNQWKVGKALHGLHARRIKEPSQISAHTLPQPGRRQNPRFARFCRPFRIIIGQSIEQGGLKPFPWRQLSHRAMPGRAVPERLGHGRDDDFPNDWGVSGAVSFLRRVLELGVTEIQTHSFRVGFIGQGIS